MSGTSRRSVIGGLLAGGAALSRPAIVRAASNELHVRRATDFATFDPAFVRGLEDEVITASILAPLVSYVTRAKDSDPWTVRPYLADSLAQGTIAQLLNVGLRSNEKWKGQNASVISDDIRVSFMRLRDNAALPNHYIMDELDKITVYDSKTAELKLLASDTAFPVTVLARGQASVLPKDALQSSSDKDFRLKPPDQSGSFTIEELVQGQKAILARNPNWTGRKPRYDRVTFHVIPNEAAARVAADHGDIDVMQVSRDLLVGRTADPASSKLKVTRSLTGQMVYLTIYPGSELMQSPDVRHGMQSALDPAALIRDVYRDKGAIAAGSFLPSGWSYRSAQLTPKPDLSLARDLLRPIVPKRPLRLAIYPDYLNDVGEWLIKTLAELGLRTEAKSLVLPEFARMRQLEVDLLLTYAPVWRIGLQQTLARFSDVHPIHWPEIDELNKMAAANPSPETLLRIGSVLSNISAVRVLAEEKAGWIHPEGIDLPIRPDGFMAHPGAWSD
jgi:ABC-type transport system substrate-binding protein